MNPNVVIMALVSLIPPGVGNYDGQWDDWFQETVITHDDYQAVRSDVFDNRYSPYEHLISVGEVVLVNRSTFANRPMAYFYEVPLAEFTSYETEVYGNAASSPGFTSKIRIAERDGGHSLVVEAYGIVEPSSYVLYHWNVTVRYPTVLQVFEGWGNWGWSDLFSASSRPPR